MFVTAHVALPIHALSTDHELGVCIWEGESVDAVREVVESAVGPWANNQYYEMHVDELTPQSEHDSLVSATSSSRYR